MCGGLQKGTNVETMEAYFLGSFGGAECMCNHSSCTANLLSFHVPVHGNTSQAPLVPNDPQVSSTVELEHPNEL